MAELTTEYVLGLYRWGLQQAPEKDLRQYIRDSRQMYDMKRQVKIPKEYRAIAQEVRDGQTLYRDIAGRITASLTKESPVYQVIPRSDTDDTEQAASIGGRWLKGITDDMTRLAPYDVVFQAAGALVVDSEAVIKVVHRPEAWANFPEREQYSSGRYKEKAEDYTKRAESYRKGGVVNPFAHRHVDRLAMLFGDGEYGDEWCLESTQFALPYSDRQFVKEPDPEHPKPATHLAGRGGALEDYTLGGPGTIKHELFTCEEWAVVINGRMAPGFPKANPYAPYLPYMRAIAPPPLFPLKFLVPALDSIATMQLNWAYLSAFPVVVIEAVEGVQKMLETLPTGDGGEPNPDLTWKPGKAWFPPPGYSMRFLDPPAAGAELHAMKQDIREMIDVVGIPTVFRGQGGSRQAGYSINQLLQASQMTYKKLVEALERQQENVARFLFNCVGSTTGQTIYVLGQQEDAKKWLGLKPSGEVQAYVAPIDQLGPPKVQFRPVLPTDEERMAVLATQAINAPRPLLSHETALTRMLQVEDPQGEIDKIWAERTLETWTPELIAEARRRLGLPAPGMGQGPQPASRPDFQPNDAANQGEPTTPGITQPLIPAATGGRPAGSYPGRE